MPTSLDQLRERTLNGVRCVQIQPRRREDLSFDLSRELIGRFPNSGQAASGDEDLAVALGGGQAGCGATQPEGGAGDQSDRMFQ